LLAVDRGEPLNGLDLDHDTLVYQQVDAEGVLENKPVVGKANWLLPFDRKSADHKLPLHDELIYRLQQSRPKLPVNPHGGIHD
jgi:hypothetical protein